MTTKDLFRCIGNLSDGMIEEAADIKRKPRWLPIAALAACAVLAISIPLAVRNLATRTPTMPVRPPVPKRPQRNRRRAMKNLRRTASPVRKNRRAAENPRQTAAGRTRIPYLRAFWRRSSADCGWG